MKKDKTKCAKCNSMISKSSKHCPECGEKCATTAKAEGVLAKCTGCDTEQDGTHKCCMECGEPLAKGATDMVDEALELIDGLAKAGKVTATDGGGDDTDEGEADGDDGDDEEDDEEDGDGEESTETKGDENADSLLVTKSDLPDGIELMNAWPVIEKLLKAQRAGVVFSRGLLREMRGIATAQKGSVIVMAKAVRALLHSNKDLRSEIELLKGTTPGPKSNLARRATPKILTKSTPTETGEDEESDEKDTSLRGTDLLAKCTTAKMLKGDTLTAGEIGQVEEWTLRGASLKQLAAIDAGLHARVTSALATLPNQTS